MEHTNQSNEFITAILAATILFVLFSAFTISYIVIYRKKRNKHLQELVKMKMLFNEELLKSQLEIQEQTFTYMSQEIHDNVGQILSLAKVQVNIMNESETMSKDLLNDIKDNIGKALNDLRDLSKSLNSERIQMLGLFETIAKEAEKITKTGIVQINTSQNGEEKDINNQKKLIVFRIIQECLQNCVKHANATEVNLLFNYLEDEFEIIIKDNGNGFDVTNTLQKNTGLGLLNIKTRISLTGGSYNIESELNKGACIQLKIPYE